MTTHPESPPDEAALLGRLYAAELRADKFELALRKIAAGAPAHDPEWAAAEGGDDPGDTAARGAAARHYYLAGIATAALAAG